LRHNTSIAILLIDIDHFKLVNDTHGHQVGDFILSEFSKVIQKNIRKYDILARYGGEEFVIVLPETNTGEALIVAEKLRSVIELTSFQDSRKSYRITASFGQSGCTPATESNFNKDNLIHQADQALYEAKEKGRNKVVSYSPKKKWFAF
jgi:diguanylate cyclase (GGDEF)-like protein